MRKLQSAMYFQWASCQFIYIPRLCHWDIFFGVSSSTKCQICKVLSISSKRSDYSLYLSQMRFQSSVFNALQAKFCPFFEDMLLGFLVRGSWSIERQTSRGQSISSARRDNSFNYYYLRWCNFIQWCVIFDKNWLWLWKLFIISHSEPYVN